MYYTLSEPFNLEQGTYNDIVRKRSDSSIVLQLEKKNSNVLKLTSGNNFGMRISPEGKIQFGNFGPNEPRQYHDGPKFARFVRNDRKFFAVGEKTIEYIQLIHTRDFIIYRKPIDDEKIFFTTKYEFREYYFKSRDFPQKNIDLGKENTITVKNGNIRSLIDLDFTLLQNPGDSGMKKGTVIFSLDIERNFTWPMYYDGNFIIFGIGKQDYISNQIGIGIVNWGDQQTQLRINKNLETENIIKVKEELRFKQRTGTDLQMLKNHFEHVLYLEKHIEELKQTIEDLKRDDESTGSTIFELERLSEDGSFDLN